MSTIAAGITPGTALVSTANTDGTLQLQVNGTTPAVTLNTAGAVGVGSTPAYGTSGQVLVSAGTAAAPAWTNQSALTVGSATNATTATTATSATTATNLAGGSAGTLPYQSATGTTAMLATGTSGQVLVSQGAAAPIWATPSTGAMVLLSSQTVSSSTTYVTFSNVFSSTYDNYLIVFNDIAFATGYPYSAGILQAQFERNGSFVTTGYTGTHGTLTGSNSANVALDIGMSIGPLGRANSNAVSGTLYCFGMNSTNASIGGLVQKFLAYSTYNSVYGSQAELSSPNAFTTGIRFFVESTNTNIVLGSFYVYGIKKS